MDRNAALSRLLTDLFSAEDLRIFLASLSAGAMLRTSLPESTTLEALAFRAVELLERHNLIDHELFAALVGKRPHRSRDIAEVRARWGDAAWPAERHAAPAFLPTSPPLLIAHAGGPSVQDILAELKLRLTGLHIPFWSDPRADEGPTARFDAVLTDARVVISLVSMAFLGADDERSDATLGVCDKIRERMARPHRSDAVTVLPILVEPATTADDDPLFGRARLLIQKPLLRFKPEAREEVVLQYARHVRELLRGAFCLHVRYLLGERPTDVRQHLERIVCALGQVDYYLQGHLCVVQDIAAYLLQEFLGCGSTLPWQSGDPGLVPLVVHRLNAILAIWERSRVLPPDGDQQAWAEIWTVVQCLRELAPAAPPGPALRGHPRAAPLELLPMWVHAANDRADAATRVTDWDELRSSTFTALADHLAQRHRDHESQQNPLSLARISQSLWFCLVILNEHLPADAATRTALAYVLREGLRFLCFGYDGNDEQRRPYYYFDTAAYAGALRTLVAYHAGLLLGAAERAKLSDYLAAIAAIGGASQNAAAEHLQHVMEVYIAGMRLLGARVGEGPHALRLGELLRGVERGDDTLLDECRRAFALAVLFHDVGHLLVPRDDLEQPGPMHALLSPELRELVAARREASVRFAGRCVDALAPFVPEPALAAWLARQRLRWGHGLVGAHYLLQSFSGRTSDDWALRSAVRAILLHNALDVRVFVATDPIAAILVLCDEIFEWDPVHSSSPGTIGKSLQVIAADVPSHEPRDRLIKIDHLRLNNDLEARLRLPEPRPEHWPTIHIELQGPQRLATPVHLLWLRKSANLGRIVPSPGGFAPRVVMRSALPFQGGSSMDRLAAARDGLRGEPQATLDEWLPLLHYELHPPPPANAIPDADEADSDTPQEVVQLVPLGKPDEFYARLPDVLSALKTRRLS